MIKKKIIDKKLNAKLKRILLNDDDNYKITDLKFLEKYNLGSYLNNYNFYIIPGLEKKINETLELKSSIGITYGTFINLLFDITEDVYVIGGFVRNSFLGYTINDLDLSFNSTYNNIIEFCSKHKYDCSKSSHNFHYQAFSNNIEGFYNNSIFKQGILKLEYTVNSLIYDIKSKILITHTPYTLSDLVNKIIRIPVKPHLYDKWVIRWDKPLRYFKLIMIGFTPYNKETESYIVNYINSNIDNIYLIKYNNIERIKKFIIVNISLGTVSEDGTFEYGKNKKNVIEYLKVLKKYLQNDVFLKIINIFTVKNINKKEYPEFIYNNNKLLLKNDICNLQKIEYNKEMGGGIIYTIKLDNKKYILKTIPESSKKNSGFIRYNKEFKMIALIYDKTNDNEKQLFSHIYAIYKCNNKYNNYLMDFYEYKFIDFINNKSVFFSLIVQTALAFYILNNVVELYHNDIVEQVTKKIPLQDTDYRLKNILVTSTDIKEYHNNDNEIKVNTNGYLVKIIAFQTLRNKPTMFTKKISDIYFSTIPYVSEVVISVFILLSYILPKKIVAKTLNYIVDVILQNNKIPRKEFDKQFIKIVYDKLLKNYIN